ncbi:eaa protein, partial [Salmonella enterica subsp. enterica]
TCVQEYVKLERLQEALAGNSPVIPDDWVMVPKEPTRQMMAQGHFAMKGTDRGKFRRIYQAMITAASALNKGEY